MNAFFDWEIYCFFECSKGYFGRGHDVHEQQPHDAYSDVVDPDSRVMMA